MTYMASGNPTTATLSASPTLSTYYVDAGSRWNVTDPLVGSSSSERWTAIQSATGIATSNRELSITYAHQYGLTMASGPFPPQLSTTVLPPGQGSITYTYDATSGSVRFGTVRTIYVPPGTVVSLAGVPSSGSGFDYWYIDTPLGVLQSFNNPESVTVNRPLEVVGNFVQVISKYIELAIFFVLIVGLLLFVRELRKRRPKT
ncbi:MAG: hypothetical protein LYZ70_01465 [Nitrososphaerales archaeon]|nr:hypothetical protein [Nitrososphaerales archaeon]